MALLSHTHEQMQDKINIITEVSSQTGLKQEQTKVLRNNTHQIEPITLAGESLEDVASFTYLHVGSVVDQKGSTDQDVKARIQKARVAFIFNLENGSKYTNKNNLIKILQMRRLYIC